MISFFIVISTIPGVLSACNPNLLAACDACCSLLFSDDDCSDVFRVKINGNGALGALWDDSVTHVMVKEGCLLDMWDVRNQTGNHRSFGLDGRDYYDLHWYAFEKKASSLRCRCTATPPPSTTTEDPITEYDETEVAEEANEDSFVQKHLKKDHGTEINITEHYLLSNRTRG